MVGDTGGLAGTMRTDEVHAHAAELPSTGGLGTALGLATLFAPLDGAYNGFEVFTPEDIARMSLPQAAGYDRMLMVAVGYGLALGRCTPQSQGPD